MCTNHDQLHYPREIREACMLLAMGNATDRDMLMRAAVQDGLVAIVESEVPCIPTDVLEKVLRLLKVHCEANYDGMTDMKLRMHERWDDELERQLVERRRQS